MVERRIGGQRNHERKEKSKMSVLVINTEVLGGASIHQACEDAIELAKKTDCTVGFRYHGVEIFARDYSKPSTLIEDYLLKV